MIGIHATLLPMRYITFSLGLLIFGMSASVVSAQTVSQPACDAHVAVHYLPGSSPSPGKKLSWWQKAKAFIKFAIQRVLGDDEDTLAMVLGIVLALLTLTPFAIMVAGIIRKRDDWLLHALLNLLIIILAWILFFVTCGLGVWITIAMLVIAFIHALWYVLSKR